MATRYKDIFKSYKYKAKVFTQMPPYFENKVIKQDLIVVFISTYSHKMVNTINPKICETYFPFVKSPSPVVTALKSILQ